MYSLIWYCSNQQSAVKIITPYPIEPLSVAPSAMRLMHVTKKELILVEWIYSLLYAAYVVMLLWLRKERGCSVGVWRYAGISNPAVEKVEPNL